MNEKKGQTQAISLYDHLIEKGISSQNHIQGTFFKGIFMHKDYMPFLEKNEEEIAQYIRGSFKRIKEEEANIKKYLNDEKNLEFMSFKTMQPHVSLPHEFVDNGSEGAIYKLHFKEPLVMKVYCMNNDLRGLEQFLGLNYGPKDSFFQTPNAIIATPHACIMEDFSKYIPYWEFVKKFPQEEETLYYFINNLVRNDPLFNKKFIVDIGDVDTEYSQFSKDEQFSKPTTGGSIFITNYDPSQANPYQRYGLGLVDVQLRER